jgi:RNA polymerase sigma-70 factor (ECF subfamily)
MNADEHALFTQFREQLRGFVRRRVLSDADADDVTQDVLTRLVQHGPPASGSVHAWLYTVARNVIIDRTRTRRHPVGLDVVELPEPPQVVDGAERELARCLRPMMATLSAEDRHVLERVDLEGLSQTDLAHELGLSLSGAKSRVQRARHRLRTTLEGCCAIDHDARGTPIDFHRRDGAECGGCGGDATCGTLRDRADDDSGSQ